MWIEQFNLAFKKGRKQFVVLIDPDKATSSSLDRLIDLAELGKVDFFLVGGSELSTGNVAQTIDLIKSRTEKSSVLFPGSPKQLSQNADGLLLLSLISGRNPDLLIGQQVQAAMEIKASNIDVLPTGYILIDGGKETAVSRVSKTKPLNSAETDLVLSTAIAGQQLGMQSIYLEAGSGALRTVPTQLVRQVKNQLNIPLWVGGGIKTAEQTYNTTQAGADVIVVGNALEEQPELLLEMAEAVKAFNKTPQQL